MSKITIIDSPMGSGKTTWAINNVLNNDLTGNCIYITPFLSEVSRVVQETSNHKRFIAPENKGEGKLAAINRLLSKGNDIVATHELFKHLNDESKRYVKDFHYTLLLDEVLDVIAPYNIKSGDLRLLLDGEWIFIDDEGFVVWNHEKSDKDSTFAEIKTLADGRNLICVNNTMLLWRYPPEIFYMFDEIYILTYLFEASILCAYFKYNNIQYDKKSIKIKNDCNYPIKYELEDYKPFDASVFSSLINIYEGSLNFNISKRQTSLSKQWFKNTEHNKDIKKLKNNIYNYLHNIQKAKSDTIMWTCFKSDTDKLKGSGYSSSYVPCNCRSTNDYHQKYNLVYAVNRYINPGVIQYFANKDIKFNNDLYALSEMIQWIWRSRIRTGNTINIYIPAIRMRLLLKRWLSGRLPES